MKYSITKLTKKSNYNINYIFENYPELLNKKIKDTYFIKLLYTLIDKASHLSEYTLQTRNEKVKLESNMYLPENIKQHIEETNYNLYEIKYTIKLINVTVKLYTNEKINVEKYIYFINVILNMCANESSQTKTDFNISLFLTPYEKSKPTDIIEPHHINSGFTIPSSNEIIIYRKEEWFKVFIHECFHLFCLDFSDVNIDFKQMFNVLFFIESDFLFFESLVEYWARTINLAIVSYYTKKNISYEDFETLMNVNLAVEQVYCLVQMKNMLSSVNLTYDQLIKEKCNYKENTNCFCYYVLGALLLSHYEQTMGWFVEHNQTLLQFNKKTKHVYLFYHYIKSIYNSPNYLKLVEDKTHYDLDNVCMTAFEIEF
jgi:hypothetical protein